MFAFIAAAVFLIELIFKPTTGGVNLTVLGLFFIALHLAFGQVVVGLWNRRTLS